MKTLVIGGTGTVGSLVTAGLVAKKQDVRVLTRNAPKNPVAGVEYVQGDLASGADLTSAFEGCDKVFMLNTVSPSEAHEGLIGVHFAQAANVKHFVYMGVHNAHAVTTAPHFAAKVSIEAAIKATPMAWTFIQPNNFFQNDLWLKTALTSGHYVQPIGDVGLHRVDVRDIADAAVNALTSTAFNNKAYALVGPTLVNGNATAEFWSTALATKVTYAGNDLTTWAAAASTMMPAFMVQDFTIMYNHFQKNGLKATESEIKACEQIVGHPLRTFAAFTQETAQAWK